jgi:nickel-dependent lactate racemase
MEKMKISIPYGLSIKEFEIKKERILNYIHHPLQKYPNYNEEKNEIENALLNPINCERIKEFCNEKSKIVILIDDWTRPTPAYKIIPFILKEMKEANVKNENISFIIARGTHRKPSKKEIIEKIGKDIFEKYIVKIHDCDKNLAYIGKTSRGTPIWINEEVLNADFRISIGNVVPHPLAGYGGGAKIITPGISGRETINYNHSLVNEPNVNVGITDGNPIREDMEEIARKAKLDFSINLILNEKRDIVKAFCGDFIKSHRECVKEYEKIYGVKISEKADILILGSCPRDATFGHATFALYSAIPLVKEGGTIILVAPCLDGPGNRLERLAFKELAYIEPEEIVKQIKEGIIEASGGAFDYCYSKVLKRNRIILVSDNYKRNEAEELGVNYANSIEEALEDSFEYHGKDAKVTIAPYGGMTIVLQK